MTPIHPPAIIATHALLRPAPRRRWAILLAMLIVAASLRLLPAEPLLALDRTPGHAAQAGGAGLSAPANPSERSGETFPGSAYFFAQDAFAAIAAPAVHADDDPAVTTLAPGSGNPHIYQIETGPAALSMPLRAASIADRARALQCLTNALYYEAGNEPEEGQRAVAQVILNRVASASWPDSVCGVVYQGGERSDRGCQFTFSCDGSMARIPATDSWARARRAAMRALSGEVFAPAGLSTFYHTLAVHPPWSDRMRPVAVIGAHIFYRLPGAGGLPGGFAMRYTGGEYAQPGPYAFTQPSRPLPVPDLMPGWAGSVLPAQAPAGTAQLPAQLPARPGLPATLPVYAPQATRPPAQLRIPGDPGLPESTIRPEYRNSGRAL